MYGLTTLLTSALAIGASAGPLSTKLAARGGPGHYGGGHHGSCLSTAAANKVASNFRATIAEPFNKAFVKSAFTVNFQDYSDGVNELINAGCPNGPQTLGDPTFPSRKAFIQGQGSQPPIDFTITNTWHNCDTVIIRWYTAAPGFVQPEQRVTGIIVIEVVENERKNDAGEPWLIETVYSEFNSGAWLYDIGNFTPTCDTSSRRSVADLSAFA